MDSTMGFLGFTTEIGEDFPDQKLPTLDVNIWIREGLIEYEFYEKPMGANIVLNSRTALSDQTKFSSLSQEVVRRLIHTSRRLEKSSRMETLEKLCQKMTNSGHMPSYIKRVMVAGWTSYSSKLKNSQLHRVHPAYKPLHLGTKFDNYGRK